jgi:hypothetical protein
MCWLMSPFAGTWCVDMLMCWHHVDEDRRWCVDVLMCWHAVLVCWCVDVLTCCVGVLMCWCVELMCGCVDVWMGWCVIDVLMRCIDDFVDMLCVDVDAQGTHHTHRKNNITSTSHINKSHVNTANFVCILFDLPPTSSLTSHFLRQNDIYNWLRCARVNVYCWHSLRSLVLYCIRVLFHRYLTPCANE